MFREYHNFKVELNSFFLRSYIRLRYPSVKFGRNLKILGKLSISIQGNSLVSFGDNVIFISKTKYNFVGIYKPVTIGVCQDAQLRIGNNSGFSGTSIFVATKVIIGDNCNFGGNTSIWDTDFHPLDFVSRRKHDLTQVKTKEIIIGNDVFVGANSIIMKGVTIGDRSIIGAGSIVIGDIPSDEIWAGNPAKFIRSIRV